MQSRDFVSCRISWRGEQRQIRSLNSFKTCAQNIISSSRTPEGQPNCCSVCGASFRIEPSVFSGYASYPNCGHLIWFPENAIVILNDFRLAELEAVLKLTPEKLPKKLLLNFERVSFVSFKMTFVLVHLHKLIESRKGKVAFLNLPESFSDLKVSSYDAFNGRH